ncbi:MAG TPA: hypothetical protein VFC04_07790, partial [Actinomycetota bacterium]|nr:hypothetical protein [Actinomycetota bacterium]
MSDLPAPPPRPPERVSAGRLVLGLVILAIGVGLLLQVAGVTDRAWKVVLPVALVAVGIGLVVAGLRSERGQGGLIALGVVLTVVLTVATVVDIPFEGGVGDRLERPATYDRVRSEYRLAIGRLTINLTRISQLGQSAAPKRVTAHVGVGELVVVVPSRTSVDVHGHAGLGDVTVFGRSESGIDVD